MNINIAEKAQSAPYDDSLLDRHSMYDDIPYTMDSDLNSDKIFKLISGNVIKAYRCKMIDALEVRCEG